VGGRSIVPRSLGLKVVPHHRHSSRARVRGKEGGLHPLILPYSPSLLLTLTVLPGTVCFLQTLNQQTFHHNTTNQSSSNPPKWSRPVSPLPSHPRTIPGVVVPLHAQRRNEHVLMPTPPHLRGPINLILLSPSSHLSRLVGHPPNPLWCRHPPRFPFWVVVHPNCVRS